MSARWGAAELKTMKSLLAEGVELNLLKQHLSNRSHDALHRQAQKYGYGVKTVNGVRVLYYGKKTRNRKKRNEEARAVGAAQEPKSTSKQTTKYAFGKIIPNSNKSSHSNTLKFIYDINKLLSSTKYSHIESVTVKLENIAITVSKGST